MDSVASPREVRATRPQFADLHDGAPAAALPKRRRFLLMVGGLSLFGPLCIDMYLPALPRISSDLHAGPSAVQFSLTTCLVGLGLGQLLIGPLSDRLGRRPPLLAGLVLFVLASLTCSMAPNALLLAGIRFVQGLGGAAGIVIARAIVRDLHSGVAAARFFSMLMLVTGAGPVLAPQIGAGLLRVTSWRGVFIVLAVLGTLLLAMAASRLPETLPPERRDSGGLRSTIRSMRGVATSRVFMANALACSLGFGAIFAYVAGSSFVMEDIYGLSPQVFGLLFALNACGLVAAGQVNARIVGRYGSERLLTAGLIALASGGVGLLLVVGSGHIGLAGIIPCLFVTVACNGFVGPNAMALALNDFPESAGSASALLGLLQFSLGAAVAPIVGIAGSHDALPMAVAVAALGTSAISVRLVLTRTPADKAAAADMDVVEA